MRRRKRKSQGIITVFVTLIMVPIVVCTGTIVDIARLKLYSAQAAMAADSYGEVVLSEYDSVLKDLYGLFSVTQNEEGINAIKSLADYTKYSFVPDGDDKEFTDSFMPYKDAAVTVSYEKIGNATLSNSDVLLTQIGDFMKYRIIEDVLDETGFLNTLQAFDGMSSEMAVVETRKQVTDSAAKILEYISKYYKVLRKINDYSKPEPGRNGYIEERKELYEGYSATLKAIYEGDDYKKYCEYLGDKENIDAAKARVDAAEEVKKKIEELKAQNKSTEGIVIPLLVEGDKELATKYVDVDAFKEEVHDQLKKYNIYTMSKTESRIKFGQFGSISQQDSCMSNLVLHYWDINSELQTLDELVEKMRTQLETCREELKNGMEEEIANLEKITELKDEFWATIEVLNNSGNTEKDVQNEQTWTDSVKELREVESEILEGTKNSYDWSPSISFEWYDFKQDKQSFYDELKLLCEGDGSESDVEGDENAANNKIDDANNKAAEARKEVENDQGVDARDFDATFAAAIEAAPGPSAEPDLGNSFSTGASIASIGTDVLNKFLLVSYDFGMFSSRVSGIEPPAEAEPPVSTAQPEGGQTEAYYDESLTGVKMSRDVNYMYGAELEYLIAGHTGEGSAKKNQNYVRNVIYGVRMTSNFVSTYTIEPIDKAIDGIAKAAAAAVTAATLGLGAGAAPLIEIGVSGALRLAVATYESVADWKDFKNREEVIFYKDELADLQAIVDIKALFGVEKLENEDNSISNSGLKLSYEDYLYIIMLFFVNTEDLTERTSNVITLNVNQSKVEAGTKVETLDFMMSKTVTAIKSTCEVDVDFLIVPENFINMFISGSDASAAIQKLNDGSYGYSVIRGY